MPSKVITEANAYKAQLNKLFANGGKVDQSKVNAIKAEVEKGGFSTVKAYELISWAEKNQDKFDPKAFKSLETFMSGTLGKHVVTEGETGVAPTDGEPKLADGDANKATFQTAKGALATGGMGDDDVVQGQLGDCYFLSSLEAIAHQKPGLLEKAIKDNKNGTYTVTFWSRPDMSQAPEKVQVTVDGKIPEQAGQSRYAWSRNGELWPVIVEKAYAQWHGGYEAIEGGMAANALEALTGAVPGFVPVDDASKPDATFDTLQKLLKSGACVVASTQDLKSEVPNVIEGHSYTVLGTVEQNGQKLVKLRNPWGETEPGNDGKNDGEFLLPIDQFVKAYAMIEFVKP